jgi:hypothetical protein
MGQSDQAYKKKLESQSSRHQISIQHLQQLQCSTSIVHSPPTKYTFEIMRFNAAVLSSLMATAALGWQDGEDCTSNQAGDRTPGRFHVFDSEGIDVACEDLNTMGTIISTGK